MNTDALDILVGYVSAIILALMVLALMWHGIRADERLRKAEAEAKANFRINCDDAETDLAVRSIVLPILGNTLTNGDSYGVPTLEDIARELVALAQSQRVLYQRTEDRAVRADAACEELRKSLMRGSAVGRWHRPHSAAAPDEWYHHVLTSDGPLLLTDEQWQVARNRARDLITYAHSK